MVSLKDILGGHDTDEDVVSYDELQRAATESYNKLAGNLNEEDGIECDICKNKGWIQYISEDNYLTVKPCKCVAKRSAYKKAKNSGLGEYLHKQLSDYKVEAEWQQKCKDKVKDYMIYHSHDNIWFMACGTSGCGKTLLGSIISNNLLFNRGRQVFYVIWTDFISRLKRDMMSEQTNAVSDYLEEIKKVDVLFLDEVIKKYNDTDLKYLIEIINYRYTNNLKTIITSERVIDDLLNIDEATFGRVVERCEGYIINIPKDRKKNYRLRSITV